MDESVRRGTYVWSVSKEARQIHQAYRFALAPTAQQEQFLSGCCGASRFWFNQGLELVKRRLDERAAGAEVDVPWSYKGLCVAFRGREIKDDLAPWRREVVVGSYQAGLKALGSALQNFSNARAAGRQANFPRFRVKGRCREAVIFQRPKIVGERHVLLDLRIGELRCKESLRKLRRLLAADSNARVLRSTVQRTPQGWFISFAVKRSAKLRRARRPRAVVGLDFGLAHLVTLSTGNTVANRRPLEVTRSAMRRLQRQLDRQRRANNPANFLRDGRVRPGKKTWAKSARMVRTERRIAKLHRRAANLRREQAHELTTALVREFGVIAVETLSIANLIANRRLSQRIADAGWGIALGQLRYKTSWSDGSVIVAADRFYPSSKTCSACGAVRDKLRLSDRVFTCDEPGCGHVQDRDLNAALNLARIGMCKTQAEGIETYVARTGRFTPTARRGSTNLVVADQGDLTKREASKDASRRREAPALAA